MEYKELKRKLHNILEDQIEKITSELLIEAEEGTSFEINIGDRKITIGMKTEYSEELIEYTNEKYTIEKID